MDEGTIVVLNGTSSAGKSTIAGELQRTGDAPMLHLSLDLVSEMVPDGFFVMSADEVDPPAVDGVLWITTDDGRRVADMRIGPLGVRLKEAMYRTALAMAATGFDVVVDDVIIDPRSIEVMAELLSDDAYFVGVRCSKDEAVRRERARGDRGLGRVEVQYDLVHAHAGYDLEVDTTDTPAAECAARIRDALSTTTPTALRRIRDRS